MSYKPILLENTIYKIFLQQWTFCMQVTNIACHNWVNQFSSFVPLLTFMELSFSDIVSIRLTGEIIVVTAISNSSLLV